MRLSARWIWAIGLAAFSGPSWGQYATLEEHERAAMAALADGLRAYETWCAEQRLFAEQARACELLIEIDPEDKDARRTLGFTRAGQAWKAPVKPKKPQNRNPDALPESALRWQELADRLFEDLRPWIEDAALPASKRRELEERVMRIDPDHARVRAHRGETRFDGMWILQDTLVAAERDAVLEQEIEAALAEGPTPQPAENTGFERDLGPDFQCTAVPGLRVVSSSGAEERASLARALGGAREVFDDLFGGDPRYPVGCTIYLLGSPEERESFFDRHPAVSAQQRVAFEAIEGAGIPGTAHWVWWIGDEAKRMDGVLRLAFMWFLQQSFGIDAKAAWVHQGLGAYLTWRIAGTHLTWFIDPATGIDPRSAYAMRDRLQDPGSDWLGEARQVLVRGKGFDVDSLCAKQAHELSIEDLLVTYAIWSYLIEARPESAAALLPRITRGTSCASALSETLALPIDQLGDRLARWIEERSSFRKPPVLLATEAEIASLWKSLHVASKTEVIASWRKRCSAIDSKQMRLLRELLETRKGEPPRPAATPDYYDPRTHAPGQPIPRSWLSPDSELARQAVSEMRKERGDRELVPAVDYDWATGAIVISSSPDDPDVSFRNASQGFPPDADLARAIVLAALDDGERRKTFAAFAHAYTDREGNVYPGLTLYDAWTSGRVMEMPDVDVLGILHDVLDDWSFKAPIPNEAHPEIYANIGRVFHDLRAHRELLQAAADGYLVADPGTADEYQELRTNLHALWEDQSDDATRLRKLLPSPDAREAFIADWVARCKDAKTGLWSAGRRRQAQLAEDGKKVSEALRLALGEALAKDTDEASAPAKGR